MKILSAYVGATLLLFGCATGPNQPTASIPLVDATQSSVLNTLPSVRRVGELPTGALLRIDNQEYQVNRVYVSATGERCRTASAKDAKANHALRVFCENSETGQWVQLRSVLAMNQVMGAQ